MCFYVLFFQVHDRGNISQKKHFNDLQDYDGGDLIHGRSNQAVQVWSKK